MIKHNIVIVFLGWLIVISSSCTKPIDFNQARDLAIEPVMETSLIFYKASAKDFFAGGIEEAIAEDFIEIGIFNNSFIADNLIKAEFVCNVENSINRAYQLHVSFLDTSGQLLDSFTVNTNASPNNSIIKTNHTEVFEGVLLERVKRTSVVEFSLRMLSGEAITENTPGEISLQSKGVFFLNINTEF